MALGFAKENGQEFTSSSSFVEDIRREKIGMSSGFCEQTWPTLEVSDYHLIFD
jgi:hypothetical protein